MKYLSCIANIVIYTVVFIALTASIGAAITKKPLLVSAVRSNSMYPLFQRGDMVLISPVTGRTNISVGDIVVFKAREGSLASKGWIVHRIIDGNEKEGYFTKGDANEYIDQSSKEDKKIQKEWISNRVITIGKQPVKIPLLGYIPVWMEQYQKSPYLLPVIAVILAAVIGAGELKSKKRKRTSGKNSMDMQLIYFFSGLTVSIMLAASMLVMGQNLTLNYEVSETAKGALLGSDVGILKVGETIEKPLSELSSKGFIPITAAVACDDPQITFSNTLITLRKSQSTEINYKVMAISPGKYESKIHVGMFLPLLPKYVIYSLAKRSYWLALAAVSLVPGLPVMLYPLIDTRMRRKTFNEIRRKLRKVRALIPT